MKFQDYEEFIYQYTIGKPSNGLEIINFVDTDISIRLLNKLKTNSHILDVIKSNSDDEDCGGLLQKIFLCDCYYDDLDIYYKSENFLRKFIPYSYAAFREAVHSGSYIEDKWFIEHLKSIDIMQLMEKFFQEERIFDAIELLQNLSEYIPEIKKTVNIKILDYINVEWEKLIGIDICTYFHKIELLKEAYQIDKSIALRYWDEIGDNLAQAVTKEYFSDGVIQIICLSNAIPETKSKIHEILNTVFMKEISPCSIEYLFDVMPDIFRFNRGLGGNFWQKYGRNENISTLFKLNSNDFIHVLSCILSSDEIVGNEFWKSYVKINDLKAKFHELDSGLYLRDFMDSLNSICPSAKKELWDDMTSSEIDNLINSEWSSELDIILMICEANSKHKEKYFHRIEHIVKEDIDTYFEDIEARENDIRIADVDINTAIKIYQYGCQYDGVQNYIEMFFDEDFSIETDKCYSFFNKVDPDNNEGWKEAFEQVKQSYRNI